MQSLDTLLPYIKPELPSCPNAMARNALLRAAIQFCEDSQAYIATMDPVTLIDGQHTYEVETPSSQSRLIEILNIFLPSGEMTPQTMGELSQRMPDWQTQNGDPVFYNMPNTKEVRVYPIPSSMNGKQMTIRAAYAPIRTASYIDDDLVNLDFDTIAAGAKWLLMLMPGKPWSNPTLGEYYKGQFLTGIDKAKINAMHDGTRGSLRVQPRAFGSY